MSQPPGSGVEERGRGGSPRPGAEGAGLWPSGPASLARAPVRKVARSRTHSQARSRRPSVPPEQSRGVVTEAG